MLLYEWYEAQRALMSPFSEFASASSKLYNHPLSLFAHTPMAHRVSAGLELMHRLAKDYEKPEFDIRSVQIDGNEVAVHEQVAIEKPFCRLVRFKRFTDDLPTLQRIKAQPTVLVVAPLSGHHSTLLRETVRKLLEAHKVYITDWTDARMVPESKGPFHLDDYVDYVQEFIRAIGPEVHVISVCQPTVPVLAAISLMATQRRADAADDDHDGRADRRPQEPDRGQQPGDEQEPQLVPEQRHLPRAGQLPGRRARRLPRLPAACRLHRHEPGPAPEVALRLLPRPGARRRREVGVPSRLLRRVQRGARHAGRVLPRHASRPCSRTSRSSTAPGRSRASRSGRRTSRPRRC